VINRKWLIIQLEENTLTLHFARGSNTYVLDPESRPISQSADNTSAEQNVDALERGQNIVDPKAITPENAHQVIALNLLNPYPDVLALALSPDGTLIAVGTSIAVFIFTTS
jgi:hypothetical protein